VEFLELDWGELAKCSLSSLAVILRFNPGDDGEVEFLSRAPALTIKHVLLQESEEALHGGVVARCSNSTHGPNESIVLEDTDKGFGPELTTPVGVDNGAHWTSRHNGVAKCSNCERGLHSFIERIANNAVGIQILHRTAVDLAFTRSVLSDVSQPDLIGPRGGEVTLQQVVVHWGSGALGVGLFLGKGTEELLLTAETPDPPL
jgi:hypothetical protein